MARITVEDCIDAIPNRFELVLLAAQRARELHLGTLAQVELDNDRHTVIALREVASGALDITDLKNRYIQTMQMTPPEETPTDDLSVDYSDILDAIHESADESRAQRKRLESAE